MRRKLQTTSGLTFLLVSWLTAACTSQQPLSPSAFVASPGSAAAAVQPVVARSSTGIVTAAGGRPASGGVVYVTSQGLYYDTFVARDPLPMHGRFQLIANGMTEFGPGDPGYLGGRWWEDTNGDAMQNEGDHFFLCPLLPPGRPTP